MTKIGSSKKAAASIFITNIENLVFTFSCDHLIQWSCGFIGGLLHPQPPSCQAWGPHAL